MHTAQWDRGILTPQVLELAVAQALWPFYPTASFTLFVHAANSAKT